MQPTLSSLAIAVSAVALAQAGTFLAGQPNGAARFGPGDCISTWVNDAGRCMVRTRCADQDLNDYNVALLCVDDKGAMTRHEFGERSFDAEETFDTLIPCRECEAPGASFRASSAGAAEVTDQSLGSSGTQREIENLKNLVGDLRHDMERASDNINELNHMVSFPNANASNESNDNASNNSSDASDVASFHLAGRVEMKTSSAAAPPEIPEFHAQKRFAHMPGAVVVPSGMETAFHAEEQDEEEEPTRSDEEDQVPQHRSSPRRSTTIGLASHRARRPHSAAFHSTRSERRARVRSILRSERGAQDVAEEDSDRAVEETAVDADTVEAGADADADADADSEVREDNEEVPVHKRQRRQRQVQRVARRPATKHSHPHGSGHARRLREPAHHHLARSKHNVQGRRGFVDAEVDLDSEEEEADVQEALDDTDAQDGAGEERDADADAEEDETQDF